MSGVIYHFTRNVFEIGYNQFRVLKCNKKKKSRYFKPNCHGNVQIRFNCNSVHNFRINVMILPDEKDKHYENLHLKKNM